MTTPICNCPENIGWLPETSWPLDEASKSSAQRIYCVDDVPVVAPRGSFSGAVGTASLSLNPSGYSAWTATGEISAVVGAVAAPLVISNTTPYTMSYVGILRFSWDFVLTTSCYVNHDTRILLNGATLAGFTSKTYGEAAYPFHYVSDTFARSLGTLAPGGSTTLSLQHLWSNTDPTGALSGYGDYSASIVVLGGTQ